jgi:hypothetical protein
MRVRKNILIAIILFFASSVFAIAQDQPPQQASPDFDPAMRELLIAQGRRGRPRFPPDHALNILSPQMRFEGKVVTGAPYSATATTESVQTLLNGARITRKTTMLIYRDSQGRTRREMTLGVVGPFAVTGEPAQLIFINDPVAGVRYALDQRDQTARKIARPPQKEDRLAPRPLRQDNHETAPEKTPSEVKTELLGKQIIEGVEAEGARSVITIPEGAIGNDRPIEIISERWYSPDLQTVVLSKHNDPRFGETVYRLTNINRSEPAQTLFEVPADYKIEEAPSRGFFRGHRMRRMRKPGD